MAADGLMTYGAKVSAAMVWTYFFLNTCTVECHYNAVQFITILHMALRCQRENVNLTTGTQSHDDFIKWKHFPHYWPFVRGIHQSPLDSPHKRPVKRSFDVLFDLCLNTQLSKLSRCWWFEMPSCSFWRHCNALPSQASYRVSMVRTWEKTDRILRSPHCSRRVKITWRGLCKCGCLVPCFCYQLNTVQCSAVITQSIFSQSPRKRHHIACPLGQGMWCHLWVRNLICILLQSFQWCKQYLIGLRYNGTRLW